MSAITSVFSYSIGRKLVMGLTGLFLISFLFVHLTGNFQLFLGDNGVAFNTYTKFMTTNPVIRAAEIILFSGFILHIVFAAILTRENKKARPESYKFKSNKGSSWFSRNMGISGSIVLVFLVSHLVMFWGAYKFGGGVPVTVEQAYEEVWKVKGFDASMQQYGLETGGYIGEESFAQLESAGMATAEISGVSMFNITKDAFEQWYISLFYVIAMILLGFHLNHGFQSAFRTMGWVHDKYTPLISKIGIAVAVLFPLGFASMPLFFLLT
ncbi:MAG: succinate dehydrogenase cytochrome b subunit [Bacteroidota bacterium]